MERLTERRPNGVIHVDFIEAKESVMSRLAAYEDTGLEPEEILYVGDGDTDMEFASKMGFIAAGVTWGYRDPEELTAAGADFLSDSFPHLAAALGL